MTLDEAIAELQVDRQASAEVVRRAYLKLLKTRKPELDPEGFRRLREAYELLQAVQARARVPRPAVLPHAVEAPAPPAPTAPQPEGPPAVPQVVAPALQLPHPNDPKTPEERAAQLIAVLEALTTQVATGIVPPALPMELTVSLLEQGAFETARRLQKAFDRWLDATGLEFRLIRDRLAAILAMTREICALSVDVDAEVVKVLARAIHAGDLGLARTGLAQFSASHELPADAMVRLLASRAPTLAPAVFPQLRQKRVKRASGGGSSLRGIWIVIFVLGNLAGFGRNFLGSAYELGTRLRPDEPAQRVESTIGLAAARLERAIAPGSPAAPAASSFRHDVMGVPDCPAANHHLDLVSDYSRRSTDPEVHASIAAAQNALRDVCRGGHRMPPEGAP